MGKRKRWRPHRRHEVLKEITNLEGRILPINIEKLHFYSWHPLPDAQGEPTQVHMVIETPMNPPMVLRLKSREACNSIIVALQNHRDEVFPID